MGIGSLDNIINKIIIIFTKATLFILRAGKKIPILSWVLDKISNFIMWRIKTDNRDLFIGGMYTMLVLAAVIILSDYIEPLIKCVNSKVEYLECIKESFNKPTSS